MNFDDIIRCRDCSHSGPRTKRKTATCDVCGRLIILDVAQTCTGFSARPDKPAQKKWIANRAAIIAFAKSLK